MPDYVELHTHSSYSLLDGASHPEELVARAHTLGMTALGLTDHDAVCGAPAFSQAARQHGLKPILGAELTLSGGHHLTLLVENLHGWHNLCYLISRARHAAVKGKAVLPPDELIGCTDGLIALSGCRHGEIAAALLQGKRRQAWMAANRYKQLFGPRSFWIELQNHLLPDDAALIRQLSGLARYLNLGCVVTNNVHYASPKERRLQDVMVSIRHKTTLDNASHLRLNGEYFLKSPAQMAALFPEHPQALENTCRLAARCQFELGFGLQDLPRFPTPNGMHCGAYLRRLCEQALRQRYGSAIPSRAYEQLTYELDTIERAGLSNYFLIVWDIVRQARALGIRCQGRGSAANSLVAYLLQITVVNPLAYDLVFERFLSDERPAIPDIDLDFDAQRREEIIQYVYERYGREHAAMACTIVTYQTKSAIRDVSKALGLPPELVRAAEAIDDGKEPPSLEASHKAPLHLLLALCRQLEGHPRHLGIHSGAMVITDAPIMGRVATEPATMEKRSVVQWDKEGLETVGLVKIDLLSLRILSAISDTLALVEEAQGEAPDLDRLTFGDDSVYEMLASGDTIGVFQVESRAQSQTLPRLRPRRFEDLIIAISLIRPGPVQGNMVHPYLRRRAGLEPVSYLHPLLKPALEETLGIVLFQEQVLKIAHDLAGFSPGQGELLRRALGSKRAEEEIEQFHGAFLAGAQQKGASREIAEQVFNQLRAFGGFSFAKSHATSFAVLVYQSAWLKCYYFAYYWVSLINNQPMGFWASAPSVLINEARRRGVPVLPVAINQSQVKCTVEGDAIRLGFNYIKSLSDEEAERIVAARASEPYSSLEDFCRRTHLPRRKVENLVMAGAMGVWGTPRRQLLWKLGTLHYQENQLHLKSSLEDVSLPPLSVAEAIMMEESILGVSTQAHIMTVYREKLREQNILDSKQLRACTNGERVRTAGLLIVHQSPPTAKGFHFLTLEDEWGMINVILRPKVYSYFRRVIGESRLLVIGGVVQQQGGVTNLLAQHVIGF